MLLKKELIIIKINKKMSLLNFNLNIKILKILKLIKII